MTFKQAVEKATEKFNDLTSDLQITAASASTAAIKKEIVKAKDIKDPKREKYIKKLRKFIITVIDSDKNNSLQITNDDGKLYTKKMLENADASDIITIAEIINDFIEQNYGRAFAEKKK